MHRDNRRIRNDESGQVLVLMAVLIVSLIAFTGFALDVGHAYLVQRQLQSATDAAALAGAQELPDVATAQAVAISYGPTPGPGHRNGVTSIDNALTPTPTVKCVVSVGCSSRRSRINAIQVSTSSVVPTIFAKIVGKDSLTVHAKATACSPCSAKKFDVMIVLDRTGSMQGQDLLDAKDGVDQFLLEMDPALDGVGLAVYPPALNASSACATPGPQRYGYDARWPSWTPGVGTPSVYAIESPAIKPASQAYLIESPAGSGNWIVNPNSTFKQTLNCVKAAGTTSYATALAEAKHELKIHGRPDAQDVIVFFTDGAANTMPASLNLPAADGLAALNLQPYASKPCQAGVVAASWAKGQDATEIYTIGYDIAGNNGGACGDPSYTPSSTLTQMSSGTGFHYEWARNGNVDLADIFSSIARDIVKPQGQLIDDNLN